jgi:hypothetical protein
MSRYIMIRRLRGPAFLLLVGALALLNQADILSWGKSWPFFLILAGLLKLAERAAMASEGGYPPPPYPGSPYSCAPDYRATANIPTYPGQPEPHIPPAHQAESDKDSEGGQS